MTETAFRSIITVTLNPTIDRVIEVPGFHIGGHQRGQLRCRQPAGKAINVSRGLAALGVKNTAVGWVGMRTYDLFNECLDAAGVKAGFIPIADDTRENITVIDSTGGSETHIRDVGPTITAADIKRLTDLLASLAAADSLIVFTGSLPPGFTLDNWDLLLDTCIQHNASVAVDAYGEALRVARKRRPWLIKPNEAELADLLGYQPTDSNAIIEAGRQLSQDTPIVLVTLGDRGAYCFNQGAVLFGHTPLEPEQIRSTVGCGDAMLAGFLAGLTVNPDMFDDALKQGSAVSAASAMEKEPAHFKLEHVEQLRGRTEIKHNS